MTPTESCIDRTFCGEIGTESSLMSQEEIFYQSKKDEYSDDDVLENFDPSRVPPRVAFRLIPAREAIEKEINDLITP